MNILMRWLITSFIILMIPHLISGIQIESFGAALAVAAILGALNFLVRPVLVVLTFPITILSLGFFLLIINGLLFYWAGSLVDGVYVDSFFSAFLAALIVSIVSWVLQLKKSNQRIVMIDSDFGSRGGNRGRRVRQVN